MKDFSHFMHLMTLGKDQTMFVVVVRGQLIGALSRLPRGKAFQLLVLLLKHRVRPQYGPPFLCHLYLVEKGEFHGGNSVLFYFLKICYRCDGKHPDSEVGGYFGVHIPW